MAAPWTPMRVKGSVPSPRFGHSSVLHDKKITVFGGESSSKEMFNDISVLNTAGLMSWTQPKPTGTLPAPRSGHTAVTVGPKMYVFGGKSGDDFLSELAVLDLDKLTWSRPRQSGEEPLPRAFHSAVVVKTRIYFMGGVHRRPLPFGPTTLESSNHTWESPPVQGTAPCSRIHHHAAVIGDSIFVFGGQTSDGQTLGDFHVYDTASCAWTQPIFSGVPPSPRSHHTMAPVDKDHIICFGGSSPHGEYFDDLHVLDTNKMVWARFESVTKATGRSHHSITIMGPKIIAFGGVTIEGDQNDLVSLDYVKANKEETLQGTWEDAEAITVASPAASAPAGGDAAEASGGGSPAAAIPATPVALSEEDKERMEQAKAKLQAAQKRQHDADKAARDLENKIKLAKWRKSQAESRVRDILAFREKVTLDPAIMKAQTLEKKANDMEARLAQVLDNVKAGQELAEKAKEETNAKEEKAKQLKDQAENLKAEIATAEEDNKKAIEEAIQKAIQQTQADIDDLKASTDIVAEEEAALLAQKASEKGEVETAIQNRESEHAKEVETLHSRIKELQSMSENDMITQAQKSLEKTENDYEAREKALGEAEENARKAAIDLKESTESAQQQESDVNKIEGEVAELKQLLIENKTEKHSLQEKLRLGDMDVEKLREEIEKLKNNVEGEGSAAKALEETKEQVDDVSRAIDSEKYWSTVANEKIESVEEFWGELEDNLDRLRDTVEEFGLLEKLEEYEPENMDYLVNVITCFQPTIDKFVDDLEDRLDLLGVQYRTPKAPPPPSAEFLNPFSGGGLPVVDDSRGMLMDAIRGGIKLKKVETNKEKPKAQPMGGMLGALQNKMKAMRDEEQSDSDDDW